MYTFKFLLGVIKERAKRYGIGQVFPVRSRTDPAEHRQAGEEVIYGLLVGQGENLFANLEGGVEIGQKSHFGQMGHGLNRS
jgi:hypothetical protein